MLQVSLRAADTVKIVTSFRTFVDLVFRPSAKMIGESEPMKKVFRLIDRVAPTDNPVLVEGRFREDLYYRLNVLTIDLPPLKDRAGDIRLLVNYFVGDDYELEDDARAALEAFNWPGNIRQLINTIKRAKILADDVITIEDLPDEFEPQSSTRNSKSDASEGSLLELQRQHITEVLERENGNKSAAARILGVERRKLYRMMKQHGIET